MNTIHEKFSTPNPPYQYPDTCQYLSQTIHALVHTFKALIKSADRPQLTCYNPHPTCIPKHFQSSCQFCIYMEKSPTLSLGSKHPFMNIFHEKLFTTNQPNLSPDTCLYLSWTIHTLMNTFKALINSTYAKKNKVPHYL